MDYCKLFWRHELDEEPVVILYEVDRENESLARRSIDIFADRRVKRIEDLYADVIEVVPIPTVAEFNSQEYGAEFSACESSAEEFGEIWRTGVYAGPLEPEESKKGY